MTARSLENCYARWRGIDYQPVVRQLPPTALLARLNPGQRVLEIGCGSGTNLITMANHGLIVEGRDINPQAIGEARARLEAAGVSDKVSLFVDDFLDCSILHQSFDAVVLIRMLTCVPELSEWCELLRRAEAAIEPGGILYVRDFLRSPASYAARYELGRISGWRFGAFAVPEGEQAFEFIAYHHSEADLEFICAPYRVEYLHREAGLSLSGNRTDMFELVARKPGPATMTEMPA